MELRHLRYFVAVADELSFTRAAARLRLAQPSLTRQVKNLETELRVQLFSRDRRRITLTEQGIFFLERTRRLLAQSALDVQDVRRRGPTGNRGAALNIGYASDLHYDLLPAALGAFRRIWPDVALNLFDLTVSEQFWAFERDEIDLSFMREVKLPAKAGLQRTPIHDSAVMAVLPEAHAHAQSRPVKLAELAATPFVVFSEERYPGAREWVNRVCQHAGFIPKIAHEVDRAPTMISCVALDLGVALLPEACQKLPHEGTVFSTLCSGCGTPAGPQKRHRFTGRPHFCQRSTTPWSTRARKARTPSPSGTRSRWQRRGLLDSTRAAGPRTRRRQNSVRREEQNEGSFPFPLHIHQGRKAGMRGTAADLPPGSTGSWATCSGLTLLTAL